MARPRKFDESGVLRAARVQFWSTGYAGTSMDNIAEVTGLGKGSLYGAFGGKRELFHRVFDEYCAQAVSGVRRDLEGPDDEAFARLAAHLRAVAAATASYTSLSGFAFSPWSRPIWPITTRSSRRVPCEPSTLSKSSSRRRS